MSYQQKGQYITVDSSYLRDVILGKIAFVKCLGCDKEGNEYWDSEGLAPLPYPHPDWGDDYYSGPCQECDGIGYVERAFQED